MLTKVAVEAALNAELDDHLGYSKHETSSTDNSRNGFASKTLRTEDGQFELNTPRDRHGRFEPQLVKKRQTRFTSMDDKILSLYANSLRAAHYVKQNGELS
jgi:transposase-like protein